MEEQFSYEGLYELLEERNARRPEGSYTTYLFEKGLDKILKKVGRSALRSSSPPRRRTTRRRCTRSPTWPTT